MSDQRPVWRILEIDLARGTVSRRERETAFLGGRGANYELLWEAIPIDADPLDGPIAWASGPLVGTGLPGASRVHVAARSPITGGIGSSSAGTDFSFRMRSNGIDQIVLVGAADRPVYIRIGPNGVQVKDATTIWGATTSAADRWLRERETPAASIAAIGPAGENEVHAAAIIFDGHRAAARGGLGAILGRKRVKAIVVMPGEAFGPLGGIGRAPIVEEWLRRIKASPMLAGIRASGTARIAPGSIEPVRNFQHGRLSPVERLALCISQRSDYRVRSYGCAGCPVRCGKAYEAGRSVGRFPVRSPALHANSITDFGSRLGIRDTDVVVAAHGLCTELGLDIDNASCAVAWTLESLQRRVLEPLGSLPELTWGDGEGTLRLLEQIGRREGMGARLACGTDAAAAAMGGEGREWSITVKGQSLQEAVRAFKGWALGIMVSERGGTHTRGAPVLELSGEVPAGISARAGCGLRALPSGDYDGKEKLVSYTERLHAVLDSLGLCYFVSDWMGPELPGFEMVSRAARAVGLDMSPEELEFEGERIHTLGRLLNRAFGGFGRADDRPPARLQEPLEDGERLSADAWEELLDEYYREHRWDSIAGVPTLRRLRDLGLESAASLLLRGDLEGRRREMTHRTAGTSGVPYEVPPVHGGSKGGEMR